MFVRSGNQNLFPDLDIPNSTIRDWLRKGMVEVVTLPELDANPDELLAEMQQLKSQLAEARAKAALISKTIKILGFELQYRRMPRVEIKEQLLETIKEASKFVPVATCLTWIGLNAARYDAWVKRSAECLLEDLSSYPKLSPHSLTQKEVANNKDYVQSENYAHFSILALSWFAKQAGTVFASPALSST